MTASKAIADAADLVTTAGRTRRFSSFLRAAEAAGLIETLQRAGPFTLFAPTDEAFGNFPSATMQKLMTPEKEPLLRSIIAFHFAQGQVRAARFAGSRIRAKSFEGSELFIDGANDGIVVNGARVVLPDIQASNGVIHGVDRVLWPKFAHGEDKPSQS